MRENEPASRSARDLAALVERARAGDQDAFTAIYEATSQELYRSIHAMVRSDELTLDIQQDAYVFAFTHLDQLSEPEKLRPWLRAIAVNRTRSVLRRQTPVLFSELEDGDGPGPPELADESPDSSPELKLEQKENARYVREILDSLSAGQRMLVGMYYYEQIPVGKIAEDLGVSPGTVKTQLYRSRKKIETAVKRLEERGVKLYGLAPMPFLLALLKRQEPAAETGRAALGGILSKSGVAAAGSSAGEAAAVTGVGVGAGAGAAGLETAAVHVGRRFFETVGGKLVLGLLAAAAVGGGVLAYSWARDKLMIGDVRPTDPVRLEYTVEPPAESEEDLSTEPSETVALLDSSEDLTEPVTEPTEPATEPTEPEPSKPAAAPTEPETSEPAAAPTEPEPSKPEIQPTAPVSPAATEPTAADSAVLGLQWEGESGSAADWTAELPEGAGSNNRVLLIAVRGDDTPEISTDNPNLLRVWYHGDRYRRDGDVVYYGWTISPLRSGTSHVLCSLNGKTTHSLAVTVPDYPDMILSYSVEAESINIDDVVRPLEDCYTGAKYYFKALVQGETGCSFSTNNPQVVKFGFLGSLPHAEAGLWCPRSDYYIWGQIIGAGDAEVYLNFKGEIVKTWIVHASEHIPDPDESDEELHMNP